MNEGRKSKSGPRGVYVKSHVETAAVNSRYLHAYAIPVSAFHRSIRADLLFDTCLMVVHVVVTQRDRILRENYVLDRCI